MSKQARTIELPPPSARDPFNPRVNLDPRMRRLVEDDDPSLHHTLRARTRLGDPTVEVVPVLECGDRIVLAGAPEIALDLDAREPPPRPIVVAIARQAVGISHPRVVSALTDERAPRSFEASGHLRFHRILRLDDAGQTTITGVPIKLDPELGLLVGSLDDLPGSTPTEPSE